MAEVVVVWRRSKRARTFSRASCIVRSIVLVASTSTGDGEGRRSVLMFAGVLRVSGLGCNGLRGKSCCAWWVSSVAGLGELGSGEDGEGRIDGVRAMTNFISGRCEGDNGGSLVLVFDETTRRSGHCFEDLVWDTKSLV